MRPLSCSEAAWTVSTTRGTQLLQVPLLLVEVISTLVLFASLFKLFHYSRDIKELCTE